MRRILRVILAGLFGAVIIGIQVFPYITNPRRPRWDDRTDSLCVVVFLLAIFLCGFVLRDKSAPPSAGKSE